MRVSSHVVASLGLFLMLAAGCTGTDFGGSSGKKSGTKDKAPTDDSTPDDDDDDDDEDDTPTEDDFDIGGDFGSQADPSFDVGADGMARQAFKADSLAVVDIAFFVDTSGSMGEEIAQLEANMNGFLRKFVEEAKLDFQLFLVARSDDEDIAFPPEVTSHAKVEAIQQKVGSHNGLEVAQKFLAGTVKGSKISLRPEATKELIFVTDDEADGPNGTEFAASLASRTDEVHVNGIVGLVEGEGIGCEIAEPGASYQSLAAMDKHKGLIQDLCKQDWDELLKRLNEAIGKRARLAYELKQAPSDPSGIRVNVDGKELLPSDFDYDEDTKTVTLAGDVAPAIGDKVVIVFPVD